MSITSALKLQKGSIRELAMLPQTELMKMVQMKQMPQALLPIVLQEKADMITAATNLKAQMQMAQIAPTTATEKNMAAIAQGEAQANQPANVGIATAPIREDMYAEEYAGGGIVAFDRGGDVVHAQRGLYLDPQLSDYIRQRETGGIRNPDLAVSPKGAMGRMQIMPKTAMKPGFGVPTIFELADELGVKYEDKSEDSAKKLLTNPDVNQTFGDMYASAMINRFGGNARLGLAAYNAGPGAVERAGNQVPDIAETKKYVAGISPERFEAARKSVQEARRDQLRNFSLAPTGTSIMPYRSVMEGTDREPTDYRELIANREPRAATPGLGSTFDPFLQATEPTSAGQPSETGTGVTKADVDARQQEYLDYLSGRRPITPASPEMAGVAARQRAAEQKAAPAAAPAAAKDMFADLRDYISRTEKGIESQRAQDRAMSILAAGLGILGGTSPYALTNVGQGALQGVALSSQLARQRSEREKDLLAARLGLGRSELAERYYAGQLEAKGTANRIAAARVGASMQANRLNAYKQFMAEGGADEVAKEFERIYGSKWRNNPTHMRNYKNAIDARVDELAGVMPVKGVRSVTSLLNRASRDEDEETD